MWWMPRGPGAKVKNSPFTKEERKITYNCSQKYSLSLAKSFELRQQVGWSPYPVFCLFSGSKGEDEVKAIPSEYFETQV